MVTSSVDRVPSLRDIRLLTVLTQKPRLPPKIDFDNHNASNVSGRL